MNVDGDKSVGGKAPRSRAPQAGPSTPYARTPRIVHARAVENLSPVTPTSGFFSFWNLATTPIRGASGLISKVSPSVVCVFLVFNDDRETR